jgi:uncharacterized iron-regulated membrane protein
MNRWSRKLHRWGAILIAVPTLLVITTGLMLQLKKEVSWIQPPTIKGSSSQPSISWETVLDSAIAIDEAGVSTWDDIDRLDVRPAKGVIKIRCKNNWEVQLDANNANVLSSAYRRSDLIESLHDGSFFSDYTKLYVFFANGLVLFGLWLTGMHLWYLPIKARSQKKKRLASKNKRSTQPE